MKLVLDSKKWDSDRWDGWEIILGSIPLFFSRHLVEQNVPNIIFVCYVLNIVFVIFSILGFGPEKVNGLAICSKHKFWDYHAWNRTEKLMPKHYTNFHKLEKL